MNPTDSTNPINNNNTNQPTQDQQGAALPPTQEQPTIQAGQAPANSTTPTPAGPQPQPTPAPQPQQGARAGPFSFIPFLPSHVTFHFFPTMGPTPAQTPAGEHPPTAAPAQAAMGGNVPASPQAGQAQQAQQEVSPSAQQQPTFGPEPPPQPQPAQAQAQSQQPTGSAVPPSPTAPADQPQPQPQQQQQGHAHAHTWQVPGGMMFTFFVGPPMPMPGAPAPAPAPPAGAQAQAAGPSPTPAAGEAQANGQQPTAGQPQMPEQFFIPFMQFPPWFMFGPPPQPMPEKEPDYARSSLLMRALEQLDPELIARLERVEGEEARCAVCFEALRDLPGVEDEKPASSSPTSSDAAAQQQQQQQQAEQARRNRVPVCPFPASETMALPCHHAFHAACLFPWLAEHTTCPTCRFDLDPSSLTLSIPGQQGPAAAQQAGDRYRPYPSQEARKAAKWQLPPGPSGKTLRESVVEREHAQGWTCSDPGCIHTVPSPAYAHHPGSEPKADQIHLLARMDSDSEPVCEHAWHPECLVGEVRSRGGAVEHALGGVKVECVMCRDRREGWVARDVWECGVRAWEEV